MNFYARIVDKSKPLTLDEIIGREWTVGNVEMSGLEMVLRDTCPPNYRIWKMEGDELLCHLTTGARWKRDIVIIWDLQQANVLIQSFYRNPIDWDTQKWVVLIMQSVPSATTDKKIRFSHDYPKLHPPEGKTPQEELQFAWFFFTSIRKPRTAGGYDVDDVVEVVVR